MINHKAQLVRGQQEPGIIVLAAILLDVRRPLESSENIETMLGILLLAFAGFGRKSFVWGSLLLCTSCHTKFVPVLENANGLIICLPSAKCAKKIHGYSKRYSCFK